MADKSTEIVKAEVQDIPCPNEGCGGKIEVSTKIYFDVQGQMDEDGTAVIQAIRFSHLNDSLFGIPFNMEGELFVGCDNCGDEFDYKFSDELEQGVQMNADQPYQFYTGDSILAEADPILDAKELREELEKFSGQEGTFVHDIYEIEKDGQCWTVWEEGERYNYETIEGVIEHIYG